MVQRKKNVPGERRARVGASGEIARHSCSTLWFVGFSRLGDVEFVGGLATGFADGTFAQELYRIAHRRPIVGASPIGIHADPA